ncbi:reverse transcriptase domain-containing protein [Dyadobacter sp. MSC1_007]|jgi:hypothetical protein|uniref:reverse transcriptase domain-containing protein n=1 Tax=Dyadobacter sp. MSC1_007 TaxID=2909264 RepID=UPI00202DCAA7|nr:reverse transcriptase domain-containing protein [Dyadobacter sp. MSC1_007]
MIARPYFTKKPVDIPWLKNRGYLHITPQLDIISDRHKIIGKVTNKTFISSYAFFPLIHSVIKERRFKKIPEISRRAHSYRTLDGIIKRNDKVRPLHYASHFDSLIYGYYADILQQLYEKVLEEDEELSRCIIAYRKIRSEQQNGNKSTIHFAGEVFNTIRERAIDSCVVLMFDIKSYFSSIDHDLLKKSWTELVCETRLPPDHYNVFKATTQFSYILLDDLRLKGSINGRRRGFDERRLSQIRNQNGIFSFFDSAKEFRHKIKSKELRIHRFPFRNKHNVPIGIPQGLPISATLANLYLLDFDKKIKQKVVAESAGFYRRYSDDIIVICKPGQVAEIEKFVMDAINERKVQISVEKTDRYMFRYMPNNDGSRHVVSIKMEETKSSFNYPLSYLGFEFYGDKILVKSANLSRFYRRMIFSVKRKVRRARSKMENDPNMPFILYRSQLKRLYSNVSLKKTKIHRHKKFLTKTELGSHKIKVKKSDKSLRSNYIAYIKKASHLLNEPRLIKQVSGHQRVLNQAIQKQSRIENRN